jgi:hypothetical protein
MAVGHTAARGFVVVVVAALLLHHFLVPVSALYRRHTNGPVKVHVRNIPQERAWHSAGGTWIGGDDSVELLISIRRPVDTVELQIEAISTMDVEVQLGKDRKVIGLDAGEPTALGFEPGPDRAWDRWSYYHFLVVAPGGTTPAALGGNRRDLRTLGVLVRFLEDK